MPPPTAGRLAFAVLSAWVLLGSLGTSHGLESLGRRGSPNLAFAPCHGLCSTIAGKRLLGWEAAMGAARNGLGEGGLWGARFDGGLSRSERAACGRAGVDIGCRGAARVRASIGTEDRDQSIRAVGGSAAAMNRRMMIASTLALSGSVATGLVSQQQPASAAEIWSRSPDQGVNTAIKKANKTYPDRFVTYFSRFMLTYDRNSVNWWRDGPETTELLLTEKGKDATITKRLDQFARFAASAKVGLARYPGEQGTQALCELMVNRYGPISRESLKQIALLFSLLEENQPVDLFPEILSRADKATVSSIKVQLRGSGYIGSVPTVIVGTKEYLPNVNAEAKVKLRQNGRLARIDVLEGGSGYTKPPKVFFNRTVQITEADLAANNLAGVGPDQYGQRFSKPQCDVVLKDGTVVAINLRDGGSGLFDGTFNWYIEEPTVEEPKNLSEALKSDVTAATRVAANGTLVFDQEVDSVIVTSGGEGYTSAYPIEVRIQTPQDCGGRAEGQAATGQASLSSPTFRESRPSLGEQDKLKLRPGDPRLTEMDLDITSLLSSGQRLTFDARSNKMRFVETSALGLNVSTPFGPRAKMPILKDDIIGWDEFSRIAFSGAVCASIGHGILVPLDTVKLKLQTAPSGKYKNIVDASVKVMREEGGFKTFVNGLQPEVLGSMVYGFISFGGTEIFRRTAPQVLGPVAALQYPVPILVLSSCLAASLAAIVSCPFQTVKVRMVADENFGPGGNMMGGFRRIVKEDGWFSLIQGVGPYMFKDVTFVLSKFSVFDVVSKAIYFNYPELTNDISQTLLVSLVSGIVAGMCAAVTSQPGDYLFAKANERKGATVITAWSNYVEAKNYGAVLSGLVPRLFYGGALIALQFVIYDYCRVLFHVSPGELNVFLDVVANLQSKS